MATKRNPPLIPIRAKRVDKLIDMDTPWKDDSTPPWIKKDKNEAVHANAIVEQKKAEFKLIQKTLDPISFAPRYTILNLFHIPIKEEKDTNPWFW